MDFAHHGLLEGLAGFDESGQHRVAPRCPVRLPAEQQPALVLHRHDHRRMAVEQAGVVTQAPTRL